MLKLTNNLACIKALEKCDKNEQDIISNTSVRNIKSRVKK